MPIDVNSQISPPAMWELDCANCGVTMIVMPFDSRAFCSAQCRATARAVRFGRRQVARFGPTDTWPDDVLLGAVGRVPRDTPLAGIDKRWNSVAPEQVCDNENWNHTWLQWLARNRRALPPA